MVKLGSRTSELIGDYHAEWLNRIAIKVFIYLFIHLIIVDLAFVIGNKNTMNKLTLDRVHCCVIHMCMHINVTKRRIC